MTPSSTPRSTKTFIRACFREEIDHIPIWMMRQAGRYLESYQRIRSKHSFQTMYKNPEMISEVTLLPLKVLRVDAAILFSDILVVPEAMGMELYFKENKGPVFPSPLKSKEEISRLSCSTARESLGYVMEGIKLVKKDLPQDIALIGFSGAPWTLACYMMEGEGSTYFHAAKNLRFADPELLHLLMNKLTESIITYCKLQIDAGAEAIQLFDTWAGILDQEGYLWNVLPYVKKIILEIKKKDIPIIYFARGAAAWLSHLKDIGADVIGIDWGITLPEARKILGDQIALQGNLDPSALYSSPEHIARLTKEMIGKHGKKTGYIANLGHGVFPNIPFQNVKTFVDTVREEGKIY